MSTAELVIQPATPAMSWEAFVASTPRLSVAIDGYVAEAPRFDGERINFNHHEGVARLQTRATCGQVAVAVRQGLFSMLGAGERFRVYANDCDQDVCLSWFLLSHRQHSENSSPLLNRLVYLEDLLDTTSGLCRLTQDPPALHELTWVFQPYTIARSNGHLDSRSAPVFSSIVEAVCARIERYVVGRGESVEPNYTYEIIRQGRGWLMVREIGDAARLKMAADGVRAFVAVRQRADGRWNYTVGRTSEYVPFDVPALLAALTTADDCAAGERWGGGDTIGGSPRVRGSSLAPDAVLDIVEQRVGK